MPKQRIKNAVFKHFHQNIGACPWSKKICVDQWLVKYCTLGRIWAKRGLGEQVWCVRNTGGESGESRQQENFAIIGINLGDSISSL